MCGGPLPNRGYFSLLFAKWPSTVERRHVVCRACFVEHEEEDLERSRAARAIPSQESTKAGEGAFVVSLEHWFRSQCIPRSHSSEG